MNIESMRARSYRSIAADEHVPEEAAERFRTLEAYDRLRAGGCSEAAALRQLGISRRTLYRWKSALAASGQRGLAPKPTRPGRVRQRAWKPRDVKAVLDVRRKYPFMGKARIRAVLARKGRELSVSTVGRIIERALAAGAIRPASYCEGRVKPKRRRRFAKWARRWKYGAKATRAGELVQMDHMTYTCDGRTLKEFANRRFARVCPVSKFMATRVYSRATAGENAAG
jgi:transposase